MFYITVLYYSFLLQFCYSHTHAHNFSKLSIYLLLISFKINAV